MEEMRVNPYVTYFINGRTFLLVFSALLTSLAIGLFVIKLSSIDSSDQHFTTYFTTMISLITLWVPMQLVKPENKQRESIHIINLYIAYFINKHSFTLVFSSLLTLTGILFCMFKLYHTDSSDPQFTIYFTSMMSLITLWIPIQFLKSTKKKISLSF